jgi:hypothetical protein
MQLQARACNRMRCFHQNIFCNLSFRVEDVSRLERIRLHAHVHSNACKRARFRRQLNFIQMVVMLVYKGVHVNTLVI